MNLENIRIVLARPLYGGNIGSVCRAMMNMGLSKLSIVESDAVWDLEELKKMALSAITLFEQRETFSTVADAVADCGVVACTTARMGLYRQHARTPREWADELAAAAGREQVAIVFGPEDKGLTNEEVALSTHLIQIPSTEAYTSINLAQAVMICSYELYVASGLFESVEEKSPAASSENRERMLVMWDRMLRDIGFMKDDKAEHMMMGVRRILSRHALTEDDVKILMGIAHQAQWCADQLNDD